eukprot:7899114-Alexandrium_andersonii.AAC.1
MSASLVGSEMCIRDSTVPCARHARFKVCVEGGTISGHMSTRVLASGLHAAMVRVAIICVTSVFHVALADIKVGIVLA